MMAIIQPRWEIDEKARIFRVCVWLRPIQPPTRAEEIARVVSRAGLRDCDDLSLIHI